MNCFYFWEFTITFIEKCGFCLKQIGSFLKYTICSLVLSFSIFRPLSSFFFQYLLFCVVPILSQSDFVVFFSLWMVWYTSVENKLDVISWDEGVDSFNLNFSFLCVFWLCSLLYYVIKKLPKESGILLLIFSVQYQGEWLEYVLCKGLVYHDEWYFDYPHITYHAHFWKELFVLFYHDNIVDLCYNNLVGNMISVVVHNNHWWHLMFRENNITFWVNFTRAVWLMLHKYLW